MGRVTNQITGTARGRVGNLVYRAKKNGESIVYPYNPDRKKPDTPKVIESNNKFTVINKFSAAVNDSDLLKQIWKTYRNIKGKYAYNKIHSFNSPHAKTDFLSKLAVMLPGGIYLEILDFKHNEDYVTVSFKPTEELIQNINSPYVAIIMIYLNTPASKRKGPNVLDHNAYLTVEKEFSEHKFVLGKLVKINSKKYKKRFKIIDDYKRVRVFLSLVFDSASGKRMWTHSSSYIYKGAELDAEYEERSRKILEKQNKQNKKPKSAFHEFRLR